MRNTYRAVLALSLGFTMLTTSGMALARGRGPHGQGQGRGHFQRFGDLSGYGWAMPGITGLQNQGVLQGVAPGTFNPSGYLTRAEMAAVLGRMLGWRSQPGGRMPHFDDDSQIPSYALPYVGVAAQQGILQGFPGGMFMPSGQITWAQLAVIIARAFGYPQVPAGEVDTLLAQIPNGSQTPPWAAQAVAGAIQAGDFAGALADMYQPNQPVTRAELAQFLLQAEQQGTAGGSVNTNLQNVVSGQVTDVNGLTLTINGQSVTVSPSASVYAGPTASSISAVQMGDTVTAVLSGGEATFIDITAGPTAPTSSATVSTLSGTIVSVNGNEIELNLTNGSGAPPIYLPEAPGVLVYENGNTASNVGVGALQSGQTVTVSLNGSGQVVVVDIGGGILGNGTLAVTTTSLPAATAGVGYSFQLQATGGDNSYNWYVVNGGSSPPPGISLSPTGLLSGSTTATGTWTFTVAVNDTAGNTAQAQLSLTVNPYNTGTSTITVTTTSLPAAAAGAGYSAQLQATGGNNSYNWYVLSGNLPSGIGLSPTGLLSGSTTATGTWSFTVAVNDSAGNRGQAQLTLTVNPYNTGTSTITVTTTSLPTATAGVGYSAQLTASGGNNSYNWYVLSGNLPSGIGLSPTGLLSGSTTATGTWSFTVAVNDSAGNRGQAQVTLTVNPYSTATSMITVTSTSLPAAAAGVGYSFQLQATGGNNSYTWSASTNLPTGISLSSNGVLSGSTTQVGSWPFNVFVTDSAGNRGEAQLTLTVNPYNTGTTGSLTITTTSIYTSAGSGVQYQLDVSGGSGSYAFSGTAPAGFTLSSTGLVTGFTATPGNYPFTVTVYDNNLHTSTSATVSIIVS